MRERHNAPLFIKEGLGEIFMLDKMNRYQHVTLHSKSPSIPLFQRGTVFLYFYDTLVMIEVVIF